MSRSFFGARWNGMERTDKVYLQKRVFCLRFGASERMLRVIVAKRASREKKTKTNRPQGGFSLPKIWITTVLLLLGKSLVKTKKLDISL
jgi:hypothetical protein